MTRTEVFVRVMFVHALVVGVLVLFPLLRGCDWFERDEKIISVDLGALPPLPPDPPEASDPEDEVSDEEEDALPLATARPTPRPTAEPASTPTPAPRPTATPRPAPTPTPSWRAKTPEEIRREIQQRNNPAPPPAAPTLSPEQIRDMIADGLPSNTGGAAGSAGGASGGAEVSFDEVTRDLYAKLYSAWRQPVGLSSASAGTVTVSVVVRKNGDLVSSRIVEPSGNAEMNASVQRALDSVTSVRPLPAEYTGATRTFQIDYKLTR